MDYCKLSVTGKRVTQDGYDLEGLFYSDGRLFVGEARCVESSRYSWSLAVYQLQGDGEDMVLLDRLELGTGEPWSVRPRVNRQSHQVFVPCLEGGVTVVRLAGNRLIKEKTLTSVMKPHSVDVRSPDTLYVCDWTSKTVHGVDIRDDRILSTLEKPDKMTGKPWSVAVLGDSIMVGYTDGTDTTLVLYDHLSHTPVRVIPRPEGLHHVRSVTTDCHKYFIITNYNTQSAFIFDIRGNLFQKADLGPDTGTWDCAVVRSQVWVGCRKGYIVIMSS